MSILLVEPQCKGFEHAKVNAAILASLANVLPSKSKIYFAAETEHFQAVIELLIKNSVETPEKLLITIPRRDLAEYARFMKDVSLVNTITKFANKNMVDKILFLSITASGAWAVKVFAFLNNNIKFACIPHSILSSIIEKPSSVPWRFPFWFGFAFNRFLLKNMCFIVLSPSILKEIKSVFYKADSYCHSIEFPYFFSSPSPAKQKINKPIRFGALGVGHCQKGTDHFIAIAKKIQTKVAKKTAEFIIVGPITDRSLDPIIDSNIMCPSLNKPMSEESFAEWASSIDYAIFCQNQEHYRFGVSGVLLDALSYGKPIVALKSSSFVHYFEVLGDIGILCDSIEMMYQNILALIETPDNQKYEKWVENIYRNREKINLKSSGNEIVKIIDSL